MKPKKLVANATMKDVALRAKVSTATVSRALTNPEKVSLETRTRVEQAAIEMGYWLHISGRHFRRNSSRTILVIVPDICDPFFSEIIRGIEVTATAQGYLVLISDCAHQNPQEKVFIDLIITKQVDGILLLGSHIPFSTSKEELRSLPPMVMANEFVPELELPTIHIDNLTAAFEAVCYLQRLGHKKIACITGPETMPLCHYRLQGYMQAVRRAGEEINPHYIVRGDFSWKAGENALKQLMTLAKPPDAIFCHNDIMALGALFQAKRCGIRIPEDLSIMGFDDIASSQYSDPPLTTVAQPRFEIGREAMMLLFALLQGESISSRSRLLACSLIARGTTSAPGVGK